MRFAAFVLALLPFLCAYVESAASQAKVVCYYDHKSYYREESGKFLTADLEHALAQCTHVIYGYAKLDGEDFKIKSNDKDLDTDSGKGNYKAVTGIKKRFPGLQILLSIGGWADYEDPKSDKYLALLRDPNHRGTFISSARAFVAKYGFDGLDLAWQFPLIRVKERSVVSSIWHGVKKNLGYAKDKDEQADEHKAGFTALIKQLKVAFRPDGYQLTASVIPHINYTIYYDLREISPYLDAIHVQAYDYFTPGEKIAPAIADFSAPLYPLYDRPAAFNVHNQIRWFLDHGAPANKLVLGIPTFGRTWKLTSDSAASGVPPTAADGGGAEGHLTHKRGILSYTEVCSLSQNPNNHGTKGLLKRVTDPSKKSGTYAYRQEDSEREGLWVSFEEPETVRTKAEYARTNSLAGVALADLSLDDFRGACYGDRYPLLKAAKGAL